LPNLDDRERSCRPVPGYLVGLGQDANGELYAITREEVGATGTTGEIFRIVSAESG
jgi:hypothetical protein